MRYIAVLPLVALAACASSNGNSSSNPPVDPWAVTSALSEMDSGDLPTTGSAQFEGEMKATMGALDTEGDGGNVLSADLDMSMDFGSGDLTGTASNFRDSEVGDLNGTATIDGSRDGDTVYASIDGDVSGTDPESGEEFSGDVDLNLMGNFLSDGTGEGPQGFAGNVSGGLSVEDIGTAEVREGSFAAVRAD